MIESHFIRSLAGYFGIPLIMFVSFALILFWLCKIFQNAVVTDVPNNRRDREIDNRPVIPPRPNHLRTITTVALLFILCQTSQDTAQTKTVCAFQENPICEHNPRKAFKKVLSYIKECSASEVRLIFENTGTTENEFCLKYCPKERNESDLMNVYIFLGIGVGCLLTFTTVILLALRRHRHSSNQASSTSTSN